MKLFVVLSVLVAGAVAYPGYLGYGHGHGHGVPQQVADTHEVAAAKAQHFAAVAAAQAHSGAGAGHYAVAGHEDDGQYRGEGAHYDGHYAGHYDDGQYRGEGSHYAGQYAHGAVAVLAPGQDTHEVAAAKAQHFAAVAEAKAQQSALGHYGGHYAGQYSGHEDDGQYRGEGAHYAGQYAGHYAHGAVAVLAPGQDTHEVAAAKAQHFAAVAAAQSAAGAGHYAVVGHEDDGQYRGEGAHYDGHYAGQYSGHEDDGQYRGEGAHYAGHYAHGPVVVLAPGQDTHEVAVARAQHLAAHAAALHGAVGHHY